MWGDILTLKKHYKAVVAAVILIFFIFLILFSYYTDYKNKLLGVFSTNLRISTVIVDAGHGGADGGAVALDGSAEKVINLQISQKLASLLRLYGFNVIMTREDDDSIHDESAETLRQKKVSDIHNREKIINENPDAIFISIHQNKFDDSSVHGTQVFYSKNNPLSLVLAQNIQNTVAQNLQKDNYRKIKQSGTEIYLLYHSQIPSVMVECGFVSNYEDLQNLKNEEYQKKIAQSIADGIIKYYKEQDENNGSQG